MAHTWQQFGCAQIFADTRARSSAAQIKKRRQPNVFKSAFWAGIFHFQNCVMTCDRASDKRLSQIVRKNP
jgi:hypothetical protein